MAMIPRDIYEQVEARLKERRSAIKNARVRLDELRHASLIASIRTDKEGGGSGGGQKSPTEEIAIKIADTEAELLTAEKWAEVFKAADEMTPDAKARAVVRLIYSNGMAQSEVAEIFKVDRQTVRRMQDAYICTAALLAADKGLLKFGTEN